MIRRKESEHAVLVPALFTHDRTVCVELNCFRIPGTSALAWNLAVHCFLPPESLAGLVFRVQSATPPRPQAVSHGLHFHMTAWIEEGKNRFARARRADVFTCMSACVCVCVCVCVGGLAAVVKLLSLCAAHLGSDVFSLLLPLWHAAL